MNHIKKILQITFTLLICLELTTPTASCMVREQSFIIGEFNDQNAVKAEFEKLVQTALQSKSHSDTARAGRDFVRLGVKAICACAYVYGVSKLTTLIDQQKLNLIPAAASLLWNRANFKYDEGDTSLLSLQAIEKYLDSLNPEERQNLAEMFRTRYAKSLHKKISEEKSDFIAQIIQILVMGLDVAAPALLIKDGISNFNTADNTNKTFIGMTTCLCLTDILQILTNTLHNMNYRKELVLNNIETLLN